MLVGLAMDRITKESSNWYLTSSCDLGVVDKGISLIYIGGEVLIMMRNRIGRKSDKSA